MAKAVRRTVSRAGKRSAIQQEFDKFIGRKVLFSFILLFLIILIVGIAITIGPMDITIIEVYKTIIQRVFLIHLGMDELTELVIWNIRLPRIMWGIVTGFGLGVAGCVMQTVLRNPLASPFTLGISAGSNFGISLGLILGLSVFGGIYALIGNAFIFALITSGIILGLSAIKGGTVEILILAGIALNYFFSAMTQLFRYFATYEQREQLMNWGMGDLGAFTWSQLSIVTITLVVCMLLLIPKLMDLNVMTAGDDTAKSLGVDAGHLRIFVMVVASFLVAGIVAFVGPIGFIGLVGPHMARMVIGADHRFQIPASGLTGATILLGADMLGMNIIAPTIIPVGVMTSIIGVPFFFYLILKRRREYW